MELVKKIRLFMRIVMGTAVAYSVIQTMGLSVTYWEAMPVTVLVGIGVVVVGLSIILWLYRKTEKEIFGW